MINCKDICKEIYKSKVKYFHERSKNQNKNKRVNNIHYNVVISKSKKTA